MTKMLELFEAARRAAVPIMVIRTPDQAATAQALHDHTKATTDEAYPEPKYDDEQRRAAEFPVVQWDAARGMLARNDTGTAAMGAAKIDQGDCRDFDVAMAAILDLPPKTVILAFNAQRQLTSSEPKECARAVQAVANARDHLKASFRMLVLLVPDIVLPPELARDVQMAEDPLPDLDALRGVVRALHDSPSAPPLAEESVDKAAEALSGLSYFEAEQNTAMSLRKDGVDVPSLWERKIVTIQQAPGLSVYRGRERFADIIGQEALKRKLLRRLNARTPLGVVVWLDEIDKALANVEGDTSGTRMYQLLKLLTEMEDNGWTGFIGVGVPGAGKSLVAKALGNEAGVPTIALDLGATESKYVGESEGNLNRAMAIIKAVGRGHAYFVATSNAASVMRPELQRRFTDGMWMFDLLTKAERAAAWKFYTQKYELAQQPLPDDDAYTAAEIRNCCRDAWEMGVTLVEAAETIIPMARGREADIESLRKFANGRFLDANKGGAYVYTPQPMQRQVRAVAISDPSLAAAFGGAGVKES